MPNNYIMYLDEEPGFWGYKEIRAQSRAVQKVSHIRNLKISSNHIEKIFKKTGEINFNNIFNLTQYIQHSVISKYNHSNY